MKPDSMTMWVEFHCKKCDALCKAFNSYGRYVDEHERYGRNVCVVMGRECVTGDMLLPGHVRPGKLPTKETGNMRRSGITERLSMVGGEEMDIGRLERGREVEAESISMEEKEEETRNITTEVVIEAQREIRVTAEPDTH